MSHYCSYFLDFCHSDAITLKEAICHRREGEGTLAGLEIKRLSERYFILMPSKLAIHDGYLAEGLKVV